MYPRGVADLAERAIESSLPTHASAQCRSSCAYMAIVLAALANGTPREVVLDPAWSALTELRNMMELHPEVEDVIGGSFRQKSPPEIRGSGYVVASLEAALWAFHAAESFSEAVLKAVNLGDDADTTGAVCGQFAGAYFGESGIPVAWNLGLAGVMTSKTSCSDLPLVTAQCLLLKHSLNSTAQYDGRARHHRRGDLSSGSDCTGRGM